MDKNILDLLNLEKVNSLLDGFNRITGFATAILDLDGNVLSKSGWRQICTEFHRKNPGTLKNCSISDTELSGKLAKGEKYHFYKCLNGLIDVAVPVKINGKHIANLFAGQFLFDEPDQTFFKKQAAKYGFDEEKYLSALEIVPVVSKENVKTTMDFLLNMVQMISEATYQKQEQIEITEALEHSEVRWQFAIEGNGDGLWDWNVQTNEIFFSKNWKEMLGYHENEIENSFVEWDKRVHPDDKTRVYEDIQKHFDGITDVYTNEHRMLCKDGSYKWILDRGKIITRNSENKPLRFIGTHADITERKQNEELILNNKNRLDYALNSIDTGVWELDLVSGDSWRSFKHDNIFGYTSPLSHWTYDMFLEHVIPEDKKLVDEKFQKAISTKSEWSFECRIKREDGCICWILGKGEHKLNMENNAIKMFGVVQDITEKKINEEELHQSEMKYKALYDKAPLSYQSLNEDGTFKDVNPRWLFLLGYQREEVIGKLFFDFLHPESRRKAEQEIFPEFKKCGSITGIEFKIRHKQGHYIDISYEGCASYNLDGSFKQTYCVFQDITTKKLAEKNLRISEEKFRSIFEQAGDAMYLSDFDGNIQLANKNACEMLGYDLDELHKMNVSDLDIEYINPEKQKRLWESLLPGQSQTIETRHKHKNGSIVPVEIRLGLFETGDKKNVLGFARDISERKKAEEELQISEEKFRSLYNNSPDMYVSVSPADATVLICNDTLLKNLGYSKEEIIGAPIFNVYHEDCMESVEKAFLQFSETGKVKNMELALKRKDGSKIEVSLNVYGVRDQNGKILYSMSSWRDITEQKENEEIIKESEEKFRSLMQQSPFIVELYNTDGLQIEVNKAYEELWGFPASTTVNIFNILKSKEVAKTGLLEYVNRAYAGESVKTPEYEFDSTGDTEARGLGRTRYLQTNIYPIKNSKSEVINIVVVHQDVTQRIEAEKLLSESEEKFRTFSRISPIGIFVTDLEGKTFYWNEKLDEITGVRFEGGKGAGWVDSIHPDDKNRVVSEWYKSTESRSKFDLMFRYKNRQGQITRVICQAAPMNDSNGELIGFVGNIVDITELKQAEDELQKHKEHLEELVNMRTRDLEVKISEIERMNKLFIGRELRMKELKDIIKDLEEKLKTC